jgi:hypothetical protein
MQDEIRKSDNTFNEQLLGNPIQSIRQVLTNQHLTSPEQFFDQMNAPTNSPENNNLPEDLSFDEQLKQAIQNSLCFDENNFNENDSKNFEEEEEKEEVSLEIRRRIEQLEKLQNLQSDDFSESLLFILKFEFLKLSEFKEDNFNQKLINAQNYLPKIIQYCKKYKIKFEYEKYDLNHLNSIKT